jgi:hypothetical protein
MANRRLRTPLATMGHVRGVYRRQRVLESVHPQRAASGQVVSTCVVRTNSHRGGHHGTLYDGRTADSRRVHAAYGPPTPPRAWLVCVTHPVAAPCRRRRPHSSHTDCHHCHRQLACPVSLHRYHPHHPLTHRLRHACNWCGYAHVLASLITAYRLRLPLARMLVTHGLL